MKAIMAAAALAAAVTVGARAAQAAAGEPSLDEVRAATERFRDVRVALAEGYVRDPGNLCETAPMMGRPASLGAMGIHYFRPDQLGITAPPNPRVDGTGVHPDFRKPSILIYEPQADGSLQLVAVENLVFQKSWHAAGNAGLPRFHGVEYDRMRTIRKPASTKRTCSPRITTATSGCIGKIRTASSRRSIRTSAAQRTSPMRGRITRTAPSSRLAPFGAQS
jgi:hypothetical protein